MKAAQTLDHRLARWQRIGLGVRLAYNPRKPDVVRLWIALGQQLAADPGIDETALLRRLLRLLVQVANDEALPWYWRSVCLELADRPLARLLTLLRASDPLQADALQVVMQLARERLDAVPRAQRSAVQGQGQG